MIPRFFSKWGGILWSKTKILFLFIIVMQYLYMS